MDEVMLPALRPEQVLLRSLYLSMDPYLLRFMREWRGPQPEWAEGIIIGRVIGEVLESRSAQFAVGDLVLGNTHWQELDVCQAADLQRIALPRERVTAAVSVLGSSGHTAWIGMTQILQPLAGHTVSISAAAGTVGGIAGQIALLLGCRVVGIAGGKEKCDHVVQELGFHACVDYQSTTFDALLATAAPDGLDRHFENVGARMLDAFLGLANDHARVALCGLIAHYQDDAPVALHRFRDLLYKAIAIQPFRVTDYPHLQTLARQQLEQWLMQGKLKVRETITHGLELAPQAYVAMLAGRGTGKHLVKL